MAGFYADMRRSAATRRGIGMATKRFRNGKWLSGAQLPIELIANSPVSGLQFDLAFDPALLATTAVPTSGPALGAHGVSVSASSPGVVRVVITQPTTGNESLSSGVLVQLLFTVTASAALDAPYPVAPTNVILGDPASAAVSRTLSNGTVKLNPRLSHPFIRQVVASTAALSLFQRAGQSDLEDHASHYASARCRHDRQA